MRVYARTCTLVVVLLSHLSSPYADKRPALWPPQSARPAAISYQARCRPGIRHCTVRKGRLGTVCLAHPQCMHAHLLPPTLPSPGLMDTRRSVPRFRRATCGSRATIDLGAMIAMTTAQCVSAMLVAVRVCVTVRGNVHLCLVGWCLVCCGGHAQACCAVPCDSCLLSRLKFVCSCVHVRMYVR